MYLHPIEATNGGNWGKFAVGRPGGEEWAWRSTIDDTRMPLLGRVGWARQHIWVMDLQTGEGAIFRPGGHAGADLNKKRIWVCPMFEPFLEWLYEQDFTDVSELPRYVKLDTKIEAMAGYRRKGPDAER